MVRFNLLTPTEIKKAIPVFFSIHYAAILYVNSSLLEEHFSVNAVSALFVLGAMGNMIIFFFVPRLLKKLGNRALFFLFVLIDLISTAGLAIVKAPLFIAIFFLLFEAVSIMIYFNIDIFLEDATLDEHTGEMRGIDLTLANAAFVIGPMLVAFLTLEHNFSRLYWMSALMLLPLLYLAFFSFKSFRDGHIEAVESSFLKSFRMWIFDGDVKRITLARFGLEFFYAFMVIFVPLYLHNILGFDWIELGTMFTIMLIPFVILQLPAGEIADRWLGEKEILILGFFFMGASALSMPFLPKDFGLWTLALFMSRVGAALVEVMTDTYFFKSVDKRNTGLISIYRISRPAGIVAAGVAGSIILAESNYYGIFFFLGIISLWGMIESLRIRDTK
jgi:MFS family permease